MNIQLRDQNLIQLHDDEEDLDLAAYSASVRDDADSYKTLSQTE